MDRESAKAMAAGPSFSPLRRVCVLFVVPSVACWFSYGLLVRQATLVCAILAAVFDQDPARRRLPFPRWHLLALCAIEVIILVVLRSHLEAGADEWVADPSFVRRPDAGVERPSLSQISVVIVAFQGQSTQLRQTLDSVYGSTPKDLLKEVIVVDDACVPPAEVAASLEPDTRRPYGALRILRNDEALGPTSSRARAAEVARGAVLAFLDAMSKPQAGWVSPLLRQVNANYRRIAVPTTRRLDPTSGVMVEGAEDGAKVMFDWKFTFQRFDDASDDLPILPHPAAVFAVTARWFRQSGGLDPDFRHWGAAVVEYSLRTWLCGGEVRLERDSVVGIAGSGMYEPGLASGPSGHKDAMRVVELWFDKYRAEYYSRVSDQGIAKPARPDMGLAERRSRFHTEQGCKGLSWYVNRFENIFIAHRLISTEAIHVRAGEHGVCLGVPSLEGEAEASPRLEAVACDLEDAGQLFSLEPGYRLRSLYANLCMDASIPQHTGHKPILFPCIVGNRNQQWQFWGGRLTWGSLCGEVGGIGSELLLKPCRHEAAPYDGPRGAPVKSQQFGFLPK